MAACAGVDEASPAAALLCNPARRLRSSMSVSCSATAEAFHFGLVALAVPSGASGPHTKRAGALHRFADFIVLIFCRLDAVGRLAVFHPGPDRGQSVQHIGT